MARLDGQVVLAPFVLPGEIGRIEREGGGRPPARGRAEIVSASGERVDPPVPTSTVAVDAITSTPPTSFQVAQKREVLREEFRRVGKLDFPGEIGRGLSVALGISQPGQFHLATE